MIEGILIGAAVYVAGLLTGRFMPARRKGPKSPKPIQPICGCGHHRSYHDAQTGECHGAAKGTETVVRDENGKPVLDYWGDVQTTSEATRCGCRHYTGPEPLPEFYAPEIGN